MRRMDRLLLSDYTHYAHLELTSRCNLSCVYCAVSKPGYHGQDFDLGRFADLVEDLKRRGTFFVMVSGHGETTLVRDWDRLCRELQQEGLQLMLNTNLSKPLTEPEVETLADFHALNASCDTVDPELFSRLRRHGRLDLFFRNMERIQSVSARTGRHPYWAWNAVVSDVSVWHLPEWAEEGVRRGVQSFNMHTLAAYEDRPGIFRARPLDHLPEPQRAEARTVLEKTQEIVKKSGRETFIQDSLLESVSVPPAPSVFSEASPAAGSGKNQGMTRDCFDPWVTFLAKADGQVAPCCMHPPITRLEETSGLEELLNNEPFRRLRGQLLDGRLAPACQICTRRRLIPVGRFRWKLRFYRWGAGLWAKAGCLIRAIAPRSFGRFCHRAFLFVQKKF
ncbi:MAG TPA: radical SAM protein [Verrucomicrobiae bacterium]|jgi:MoaA/NifB/PqqE/SkfB family radical SAM enzyme|nr:radical SAM protein [Verrucomicrobiae bacterium]